MTLRVDESSVLRLAANRELAAAFPFLAALAARRPARGCCPRPKDASAGAAARAVRAVSELSPARRELFKKLAGASRVLVRAVRASRVVELEF